MALREPRAAHGFPDDACGTLRRSRWVIPGEVAVLPSRWRGGCRLAGLAVSALALLLAPLLMPASYSWVLHTTSESAAQGVRGAWLARVGLLLFDTTVVVIAVGARGRWGRWTVWLHTAFAFAVGVSRSSRWSGGGLEVGSGSPISRP